MQNISQLLPFLFSVHFGVPYKVLVFHLFSCLEPGYLNAYILPCVPVYLRDSSSLGSSAFEGNTDACPRDVFRLLLAPFVSAFLYKYLQSLLYVSQLSNAWLALLCLPWFLITSHFIFKKNMFLFYIVLLFPVVSDFQSVFNDLVFYCFILPLTSLRIFSSKMKGKKK